MEERKRDEALQITSALRIVTILSFIGMVATMPLLPEKIPLHWNWEGQVDSWGSRLNILWMATLPLVIHVLMGILPSIDPKRSSYYKHAKAYKVFRTLIVTIFIALGWLTVAVSLGVPLSIGVMIRLLVGILFIGLGNYMGQLRNNYFVGIRTPWTLANEDVWRKTHRRGGWVFVLMGLGFLFSLLVPSGYMGAWIALGGVLLGVGYLVVYSYVEYKRFGG